MAGYPVAGDLYYVIDGQLLEIKRQLRQPDGYPHDPLLLKAGLQQLVERGRFADDAPQAVPDLFIVPEAQLAFARQRNHEHGWGFTDEDFTALGDPPPWPSGYLTAIILDVTLDLVGRTFEEAWYYATAVQPGSWRWNEVKSDADHLRLLAGITFERGLRWRVVDLAAHWDKRGGTRLKDVRDPKTSPSSAILWAASYFPKWVQAMEGVTVPYIWIPGYEISVSGSRSWSYVPCLYWSLAERGVRLSGLPADGRFGDWAVPAFRE